MTANTWFKVKGSKVKVTAYVTANTDSLQYIMSRFVTYLPRQFTTRMRIMGGMAVARHTSQNVRKQYFQTKQARKTQNVWRNVVRRSRCNAFAIARFLVLHRLRDHITPLLCQLHWLPVQRRVEFKIACLVHQLLAHLHRPT